ncbi:DUF4407 domain-containing protein [Dactylosporangium darangshiense]|uniref:DUF4407 domain-containing protein n=1 Tax=Dactylosporangium darangshiense TaxID=579108 RepID=A0ABP8D754_9ACTN
MRLPLVLAWIGGAETRVLRESRRDAIRYSAMGAVILGTAGMAGLSATFALTTAVRLPLPAAVVAGVLWGLLILSLDRMLVIGMNGVQGRRAGLAAALPRLALALLIGTVISVPLVLRIFEPEINAQLKVMHAEKGLDNQAKLDAQFADIADRQRRVDELNRIAGGAAPIDVSGDPDVQAAAKDAKDAQDAYNLAEHNAQCELDGTCGTGSQGPGPAYESAKAARDAAKDRLDRANTKLQQVTDAATARLGGAAQAAKQAATDELATAAPELERRKAERAAAQLALDNAENDSEGLLARLEALEALSDGHPMMWTAHLALMALFACIELLPVLAKLMSRSTGSLYDKLLESRERHAVDVEQERQRLVESRERHAVDVEQERQRRQDEIEGLRADARRDLEADRLARQVERGRAANAALAEQQEALARRAIQVWAELAVQRTDQELRRWYEQHSRGHGPSPALPSAPAPAPGDATATHPTAPVPAQPTGPAPVNGQPHPHAPAAPAAGP